MRKKRTASDASAPFAAYRMQDEIIERDLSAEQPQYSRQLVELFGEEEYAELREMSLQAKRGTARARGPRVYIVHGITGSKIGFRKQILGIIDDIYWLDPIDIGSGGLTSLSLNTVKGRRMTSLGVFLSFYLKMKLTLQLSGFDADFHHYDWRSSIHDLGQILNRKLRGEPRPVYIVAHSMGGLVARAAMGIGRGAVEKVNQLIMLGTPNYGSFAPVKVVRGSHSLANKIDKFDLFNDRSAYAKTFWSFTGLLGMLPFPDRANGLDLMNPEVWPDAPAGAPEKVLSDALQDQRFLEDCLKVDGVRDRMTMIAGVNNATVTGVETGNGGFVYTRTYEGDGTVPLALALVDGIPTYYTGVNHGGMPNHRSIRRAVRDLLELGETNLLDKVQPGIKQELLAPETDADLQRAAAARTRTVDGATPGEMREMLSGFASLEELPPKIAGVWPSGDLVDVQDYTLDGVQVCRKRQQYLEVMLAKGSITEVDSEALALGIWKGITPSGPALALDGLLDNAIWEAVNRRMISGDAGEINVIPIGRSRIRAEHLLLVGLGALSDQTGEVASYATSNAIRTLLRSRVSEVATVLFGAGSGVNIADALRSVFEGVIDALSDMDGRHSFRRLTICEVDPQRYAELQRAFYQLVRTELFQDFEVTILEEELPEASALSYAMRDTERDVGHTLWLSVENRPDSNSGQAFRMNLLTPTGKAAVLSHTKPYILAELNRVIQKLNADPISNDDIAAIGQEIAEHVLPAPIRQAMTKFSDRPLTIVHDADSSRIPWEILCLSGAFPCLEGGLVRRFVADKLAVARWIEERRNQDLLNVLLIVDPTHDLKGAFREGEVIAKLFDGRPGFKLTVIWRDEATRKRLNEEFRSGKYEVIHYAGHAQFNTTRPWESGIRCSDGVLSGADLAQLKNLPSLVYINACEAGRIRKHNGATIKKRNVDELAYERCSLAESFLRGGVAYYLGTYWPVGDRSALLFSETFYTKLVQGETLGKSLLAARKAVYDNTHSIDWADYILFGAPEFRLKLK